jgi:hypothetical protein
MQRSTALFLFAVLVAAAVAGIWWRAHDAAPPPPAIGTTNGTGSPEPNGGATGGVQQPGPRAGETLVRVTVAAREQYVPPPPPRVAAAAIDRAPLPARVLAGAGAGFDARADAIGAALAEIEFEGRRLIRQVALASAEPAHVTIGARLQVRGRVRDAAGAPIPTAAVWLGELEQDGRFVEWRCDEAGQFTGEAPAGSGVPCVVRAEGYSMAWRAVAVAAPVAPVEFVLLPGSALAVQLAAAAVAIEDARVYVVPLGAIATALAQFPFFLQALTDGYAVDTNGRAVVPGLPADGEVGVLVRCSSSTRRGRAPSSTTRGDRSRACSSGRGRSRATSRPAAPSASCRRTSSCLRCVRRAPMPRASSASVPCRRSGRC